MEAKIYSRRSLARSLRLMRGGGGKAGGRPQPNRIERLGRGGRASWPRAGPRGGSRLGPTAKARTCGPTDAAAGRVAPPQRLGGRERRPTCRVRELWGPDVSRCGRRSVAVAYLFCYLHRASVASSSRGLGETWEKGRTGNRGVWKIRERRRICCHPLAGTVVPAVVGRLCTSRRSLLGRRAGTRLAATRAVVVVRDRRRARRAASSSSRASSTVGVWIAI